MARSKEKSLAIDAGRRADPAASLRALCRRRLALNAALAGAPSDPTHDREALTEARGRAAKSLSAERAEMGRVMASRRLRDRFRRNGPEAWAEARVAQAVRRLADVDRELAAVEARQAERDRWLAERAPEVQRADALDRAIAVALDERVSEVCADPPRYLTDLLGHPPDGPVAAEAWATGARAVESYRAFAGVTDQASALGQPEPGDGRAWCEASEAVAAAKGHMAWIERLEARAPVRSLEPPGLDMGIGL
jgi:hypothetical protein